MADRHIETRDGFRIGVTAMGDPAAQRLVVLFHPTPGSGSFDPDPGVTRTWGVHLLGFDRPGYGASDPAPPGQGPTADTFADAIAHYFSEVEATAASLGNDSARPIGVIGWGTGGLFAASLASRHPNLVDRLALIDTPRKPWMRRPSAPFAPADLFVDERESALGSHPGIDRRLTTMLVEAAQQADAGVAADRHALKAVARSTELSAVTAQTVLVYGARHPEVHAGTDGAWFRKRIRNARTVVVTDSAGLAIGAAWSRILAHVAPHHGDVPTGLRFPYGPRAQPHRLSS